MGEWPISERMQEITERVGNPNVVRRDLFAEVVDAEIPGLRGLETNWVVIDLLWKIQEMQTRIEQLENRNA
jgi:hypothetical protein